MIKLVKEASLKEGHYVRYYQNQALQDPARLNNLVEPVEGPLSKSCKVLEKKQQSALIQTYIIQEDQADDDQNPDGVVSVWTRVKQTWYICLLSDWWDSSAG